MGEDRRLAKIHRSSAQLNLSHSMISEKLRFSKVEGRRRQPSSFDAVSASSELCDWRSNSKPPGIQNLTYETEDDFDNQRLRDAVVVSHTTIPTSSSLHHLGQLRGSSQQHPVATISYTSNSPIVHRVHEGSMEIASDASNRFKENIVSHASGRGNSCSLVNGEEHNQVLGRFDVGLANSDLQSALESSIISNILDLDSWDDSLTSTQLGQVSG